MEIDLLQHSTYNVETIRKNKELFNRLFESICRTYSIFHLRDNSLSNERNVSFAPGQSRIQNVFINIKPNGEFNISFRGGKDKLKKLEEKGCTYETSNYRCDATVELKGLTEENYKEHLPNIVKALEYCDYSFK